MSNVYIMSQIQILGTTVSGRARMLFVEREKHVEAPVAPFCAVVFAGLTAWQTVSILALMLSRCDARQLIA